MEIEVTKKDLIRLLRGTIVPFELWNEMPKDIGKVQGGGWTDPEWKWDWKDDHFLERTEQELYDLYCKITRY